MGYRRSRGAAALHSVIANKTINNIVFLIITGVLIKMLSIFENMNISRDKKQLLMLRDTARRGVETGRVLYFLGVLF